MKLSGLGNSGSKKRGPDNPRTFDAEGELVIDASEPMARQRMDGLGADDTRSIGAALWEMLHPGQVQEEYQAVGKDAPSYSSIVGSAFDDAMTAAYEGQQQVKEGATKIAGAAQALLPWIVIGAVALAVVFVADKIPRIGGRK